MDAHHAGSHSERGHMASSRPGASGAFVYEENGRFYGTFRMGKYLFPVDEAELDRLDIFHKFFLVARRDVYFSVPIQKDNPRILDLGCGTGIWAIEMAERFPNGQHIGVDLNLIQPEFIPPNISFQQRDIEMPWQDLNPGSWDLIHLRTLNGSISDWPKLYREIHRHLVPYHGYMEQVEIDFMPRADDGTLPPNSALLQWATYLLDAMDSFNRSIRVDSNVTKQRLVEAGFVDIKEERMKFALNGWPEDNMGRDIGRWFNLGFIQGVEALTLAPLFRALNKTPAEIRSLLERVQQEARSNKVHAYFTMHTFTARRQL